MGFFDSFKMALHNLWHNKSRTVLTVIIVFVVSTLIMAMCLIGTNFISNSEKANRQYFDKSGTEYNLEQPDSRNDSRPAAEYYKKHSISLTEINQIVELARAHRGVVEDVYFSPDENVSYQVEAEGFSAGYNRIASAMTAYDFPLTPYVGAMVEGPLWSAADRDSQRVWVSETYVRELARQNFFIKVGTQLRLTAEISRHYEGGNPPEPIAFSVPVIVAGIVKPNAEGSSLPSVIVSIDYMTKAAAEAGQELYGRSYSSLKMHFQPIEGTYRFSDTEKELKAFVSAVNQKLGKGFNYEGKEVNRFSAQILEDLNMSKIMGLVIMAVLVLLAFLILLLSVGSVANTIIISVDKNRKFIGLMKAMGLNNRGVKKITYKEATITILLGVLLAVLVVYLARGLMLLLMTKMLGGLFGSMGVDLAVTFTISPVIPVATFLVFLGMAILFSKGSLNKMGKADVISIISEVA